MVNPVYPHIMKNVVTIQPLKELPDCPSLTGNLCAVVGVDINTSVCAFCEKHGPFCGKTISDDQTARFKVIARALANPRPIKVVDPEVFRARSGWQKAKETWVKADSFLTAIRSRGLLATLADAVGLSAAGNRVDERTYQERHKSCFGDQSAAPCPMLVKNAKGAFCGACGCGEKRLARLDDREAEYSKLHYPVLQCPLQRPGFSNAERTS